MQYSTAVVCYILIDVLLPKICICQDQMQIVGLVSLQKIETHFKHFFEEVVGGNGNED